MEHVLYKLLFSQHSQITHLTELRFTEENMATLIQEHQVHQDLWVYLATLKPFQSYIFCKNERLLPAVVIPGGVAKDKI